MTDKEHNIFWYAARTRYGQEITVRDRLSSLGFDYFIPTTRAKNYRGKTREKPVINNLVFLRASKQEACDLKVYQGLPLNYMYDSVSHSMLVVPDKQMDDFMRVFDQSIKEGGLVNESLAIGEKVRVTDGPLKGVEGHVVELLGEYYVSVGLCGLVCARAKVARAWLEKIN